MTVLPLPADLLSIVQSGGTFNVSRPSRVLLVHAGFDRKFTDETRALLSIARTVGVNLVMIPETAADGCVDRLVNVVRDFMAWARKPGVVLSVAFRPDFVISDDTIYIAKNHVIDDWDMLQKLLSRKLPWLLVKNDDVSNDPFITRLHSRIEKEASGLFSSAVIFSNLGLKNFKDLLSTLDSM
jgi:hypothetical protein